MSGTIGDLKLSILVEADLAQKNAEKVAVSLKKVEDQSNRTGTATKKLSSDLNSTAKDYSNIDKAIKEYHQSQDKSTTVTKKASDSTREMRGTIVNLGYGFVDLSRGLSNSTSVMGDFIATMGAAIGTGSVLLGTLVAVAGAMASISKYSGFSFSPGGFQSGLLQKGAEMDMQDAYNEAYIKSIEEGKTTSYADEVIRKQQFEYNLKKSQVEAKLEEKRIQEELKNKLKSTKVSSNSGSKTAELKTDLGYYAKLNKELDEIKAKISNQTAGESTAEGLFVKKADLESQIELIKAVNNNFEDYIKLKSEAVSLPTDLKPDIQIIPKVERQETFPEKVDRLSRERDKKDKMSEKNQAGLEASISLAQQLSNILGIGADTFAGQLISGLQEGLSLANSIAGFLTTVFNIGSGGGGGIFSLLGLASGGSVPGSGSGDTVPAMLTPGEFVINKSRASQLGTGFLTWLNGGGLFNSIAGQYSSGGMVAAAGSGGVQVVVLDSKIKGNDIVLSQARTDKINKRRMI